MLFTLGGSWGLDVGVMFYGQDKAREVGLILSIQATATLKGWKPISDWIITARFYSKHGKMTFGQVYAPIEMSSEEERDGFFGQLQDILNNTQNYNIKIVIWYMNAQVIQHHEGVEVIVGPHRCARETTDNGQWLLTFCATNGFSIGNTFFNHKLIIRRLGDHHMVTLWEILLNYHTMF